MYSFIYILCSVSIVLILLESIWIFYCALRTKYLAGKAKVFSCDSNGQTLRTLVVGDSFILGVGVTDPATSLGGLLSNLYGKESTLVRAVSGVRLHEVIPLLVPITPSIKWERVVIFCGGMDIVLFSSEKKIRNDLHALFASAKKYSDQIVYISPGNTGIVPVFHFPLSKLYTFRARKFHRVAEEIAAHEAVDFVSTFSEAENSPFKNRQNLYVSDFNHLNDEGCSILFESIKAQLT